MTKIKKLAGRPKTKADKLRERREAALESNQSDLVREKQEREQLFLDEGGSSSDTDTEAFFSKSQVKKKPDQEERDEDEEEEIDEDAYDFSEDEDGSEQNEEKEDSNEISSDISAVEDDDDAPEEVSSKQNNGNVEDEDDEEEEKASEKKSKTKKRKRRAMAEIKEDDAESVGSATENSRFKVVILDKDGPSKFLNPAINFREELLRLSTEKCRVKKISNIAHVEKWRRIH